MFKKNRQPWEFRKSKLTHIEYFWFKKKLAKRNRQLEQYYKKFVTDPDFKADYIYFAAPFQPEALSNLLAGTYEDIFLVLDMISEVLPKGWYIFYKEHPATFNPNDKGALERSRYFYDKVASYDRLKFISHEINTFDLIDNSRAVCTVGGTVGWESVVRGRPALVFGSLWYQACNSVCTIKNRDDMHKSMKNIINGYHPSEYDVARYAEALYRNSHKELASCKRLNQGIKMEYEDLHFKMERVGKAFADSYEKFYANK